MKIKNIKLLFILTLVGLLGACDKKEEVVLKDISTTDTSDVKKITDEIGFFFEGNDLAEKAKNGRTDECYEVTFNKNTEIEINFEADCVGEDGKSRSGKMIYSWTGIDGEAGFTSTIVYENFTVDGYTIDGTFSIKDLVINLLDGTLSYTILVENAKFTDSDGKFSNLTETLTVTTVSSAGAITDDLDTTIIGDVSGTTKDGNTYVATITKELLLKSTCDEAPVSGSYTFTINQDAPMSLDYGDGTCDSLATLTRGAFSKEIDLSKD